MVIPSRSSGRSSGKIKSIEPRLAILVPCYPPREPEKPYDFDIDAVIISFYNAKVLQDHEKLLDQALKKFPGKPLMGSLYLNAGSEGRWLCSQAAGPGPVTNGPCVLT